MGTQMLAVTDVIELHYTTITPELLLDRTALSVSPVLYPQPTAHIPPNNNVQSQLLSLTTTVFFISFSYHYQYSI